MEPSQDNDIDVENDDEEEDGDKGFLFKGVLAINNNYYYNIVD